MKKTERYQAFLTHFLAENPTPRTELLYNNPFELLIAVVLSAQCTDKRINKISPALFARFPTAEILAQAPFEELFFYIKSISYPKSKTKYLMQIAHMLIHDFQREIPQKVSELQKLPGVGRKTAHVVAATLYDQPTLGVDTHVFRVAKRLGLVSPKAKTPLAVEKEIVDSIPKKYLSKVNHWLVLHGRYICKARKPLCSTCPLSHFCHFFIEKTLLEEKKND